MNIDGHYLGLTKRAHQNRLGKSYQNTHAGALSDLLNQNRGEWWSGTYTWKIKSISDSDVSMQLPVEDKCVHLFNITFLSTDTVYNIHIYEETHKVSQFS